MAYGDVGGSVTELVITCKADGLLNRGDALTYWGDYRVGRRHNMDRNSTLTVFGQAMADARKGESLPVKVRGICRFKHKYCDVDFEADGDTGVHINTDGLVCPAPRMAGSGIVLKSTDETVDVLL